MEEYSASQMLRRVFTQSARFVHGSILEQASFREGRYHGTALKLLSGGGQSCLWEVALSPFPESATLGWVIGIGLAGVLAGAW
jgi:hypothetical protein